MHEFVYVIQWYLVLFALGVVSIPISVLFFDKFYDKGFGLTKTISLLFATYVTFLLCTSRLLRFGDASIIVGVAVLASVSLLVFKRNKNKIIAPFRTHKKQYLFAELAFLSGYMLWSYVRAHQPDINGLEKFMDYGFINAISRSEYLPPNDMWAAGETINYYWYGHYISAFLNKLSRIPAAVGYNLMLATIMGMVLSSLYSVGSSLISSLTKISPRLPVLAGLLCGLLVVFAGNFHTPYYIIKEGIDDYWYPDATRFIGHNPDTNDKTIHEFPIYSFVVSDLHAHVLSLPLVLLVLAIFANLFINKYEFRDLFWINTIFISFVMGVVFMTNSWDFGNYLVISSTLLFLYIFRSRAIGIRSLIVLVFVPIYTVVLAILFASPFLVGFESIAEGVEIVKSNSPIWQLTILWGYPLVISICIGVFLIYKYSSKIRKVKSIQDFLNVVPSSDLFVIGLLIAGWILVLIPEMFYLKDIYEATHHRANTMFKLTYQAYVVFYFSSGYVIIRTLAYSKGALRSILSLVYILSLVAVFIYPWLSVRSYYNNLNIYVGLAGDTWLLNTKSDYFAAINFLESQSGNFNILEASGDSYTEYNLVSAYTGIPTVNGWFVHEWLWRGDSTFPQTRADEIKLVYESEDGDFARKFLNRFQVKYVVIGPHEKEKYVVNESLFEDLGEKVFSSGDVSIYQVI